MVHFLLKRPIAVIMAFLACVIVGLVTYFTLPVSLLPSIAIPHITVQISGDNMSARELENNVTAPVRRQLLQVGGLSDIKSESRDGMAVIRLAFDYGVNTDLAYIEVNEKIDAAMNSLPRDTKRPKAIKASATDIPVLYLSMTLRDNRPYTEPDEYEFLQMCELAENVVRRRIEQLPEIAIADITGVPAMQLRITPDADKMKTARISISDIESALAASNVDPGSMMVRDGIYEYNIHITNQLRTVDDVANLYLRKGDKLLRLGDLAEVEITAANPAGYSLFGGKRAVTLAIIKQSEENMDKMKESLASITEHFSALYPGVEFTQSRNQTELLDYTISNLVQNLILGLLLVFAVTALFMGEARSSIIIGSSIIVAIIITFLLFYLFNVSLNIISLSGLILAVGMMIDNSTIVTENITQFRQRGVTLMRACDLGTTEMITPLLSSSLTTVAVFVPLIFMSGIAGAIFTDQAFAITAGLAVSYIVGIMLLPVVYMLVYRGRVERHVPAGHKKSVGARVTASLNSGMAKWYSRASEWFFHHRVPVLIAASLVVPVCIVMFYVLPVERMPRIDQTESIVKIEWNENINLDENTRRVNSILSVVDSGLVQHSAYVGMQDYLLEAGSEMTQTESEVYLKVAEPGKLKEVTGELSRTLAEKYPGSTVTFSPPENIFEKIFSSSEAQLEARVFSSDKTRSNDIPSLLSLEQRITAATRQSGSGIPLREVANIIIDREKLLVYRVDYRTIQTALLAAFKSYEAGTLRSYQQYLPMGIGADERSVEEILASTLVTTQPDDNGETSEIPLRNLVRVVRDRDLKNISAGRNGEYVPLAYNDLPDPGKTAETISETVELEPSWDSELTGSVFSNARMMDEMVIILAISILLMYFILCAQFESFLQPLIVLVEIPLDIAFALLTLWIFGHTLNLMSAIGIIVTCGIVVNDSILKLDAINELRKEGLPLMEAVHTAGVRRLRPIIMTSLTTIFAMVPTLFTSDMGSELQRPLAIAMIGSMIAGTLISIFLIPLIYWLIYRKHHTHDTISA